MLHTLSNQTTTRTAKADPDTDFNPRNEIAKNSFLLSKANFSVI